MKIVDVICEPVRTGFYRDDQAAIRAGATHDGFLYKGRPLTPGFQSIRQPGMAVSVMLVLSDGQVALGDCAEVQYSGAGGRAPILSSEEVMAEISQHVMPLLIGRTITGFRDLAEEVDTYLVRGKLLGTATRYGVTQAHFTCGSARGGHHHGRSRATGIPDGPSHTARADLRANGR